MEFLRTAYHFTEVLSLQEQHIMQKLKLSDAKIKTSDETAMNKSIKAIPPEINQILISSFPRFLISSNPKTPKYSPFD